MLDRVGKLEERSAYILFKDHKKNFPDKKQTRLINPTKTELGSVSKDVIQKITSRLMSSHKYNLWKNSMDTIDWFKKIKDKKRSTFVQFDIIEFYPSITKELLVRSLNHAREYTEITEEEIEIILASRKTVLSDNRRSWVDNFDVPMGAYDSAQVADLVGIYILDTLGRIVNSQQVGLYREGGIIYIPDSNGPKTASIQKKIIRAFKLLGFRIQIASNLKIVDFLDVTLNLNNGTFKPFSKNDSAPRYINISSNHPRSVLRQIPIAVNQRINKLSSGKKMFEENKRRYDDALKDSGFQGRLKYLTPGRIMVGPTHPSR